MGYRVKRKISEPPLCSVCTLICACHSVGCCTVAATRLKVFLLYCKFFNIWHFLSGMPAGQAVSRFWLGISFFFFVVVTNRHINLCIKICPPLVGMYCSDCLRQKRPNQNLLFRHISRERGASHPFLCDVKLSFDLLIKPTLNSALSQKGFIVLIALNKNGPIKIHYRGVYHEGGD